jgi:hypothetical protein
VPFLSAQCVAADFVEQEAPANDSTRGLSCDALNGLCWNQAVDKTSPWVIRGSRLFNRISRPSTHRQENASPWPRAKAAPIDARTPEVLLTPGFWLLAPLDFPGSLLQTLPGDRSFVVTRR